MTSIIIGDVCCISVADLKSVEKLNEMKFILALVTFTTFIPL